MINSNRKQNVFQIYVQKSAQFTEPNKLNEFDTN